MSKNIQLTPIQTDYNQHVTNQSVIRDNALNRITQIRKEVTVLHIEETKLEDIVNLLTINTKK